MKQLLFLYLSFLLWPTTSVAQSLDSSYTDSLRVVHLLSEAAKLPSDTNLILWFARKFVGQPYVAKTLEVNQEEKLIVNLRELDCTTYVETVLALYACTKNGQRSFAHFKHHLQQIRYRDGIISYPTRLHYFSEWIDNNTIKGYVCERQTPNPPFTAIQTLCIDYMRSHVNQYPMLVSHPEWISQITDMERRLTGNQYRYIPKGTPTNTTLMRRTIHDGNIIALTTMKPGLDTSHIGIAVWHDDGLHLLNASLLRKKVVEEILTIDQYQQRQTSQTGFRVVEVK